MIRLTDMEGSFDIHRCSPEHPVPAEVLAAEWFSVSRSVDELSIVCSNRLELDSSEVSRGWRGLKVEGPLDFTLIGILSSLTGSLADAGISVFAISTFDTDYLLVREDTYDAAKVVLRAAGFVVG